MEKKICNRCEKSLLATKEHFNINREHRDGLNSICKKCCKKYRTDHKDEIRRRQNIYNLKHKDEIKKRSVEYERNRRRNRTEYRKKYYQKHRKEFIEHSRDYYKNNTERHRVSHKKWCLNHSNEIKEYSAKYYREHKKERSEYVRNRLKTDLGFKLKMYLRNEINIEIKRQGGRKSDHTSNLIGCSIGEFIKYIENKFLPGMTWKNHSREGWHIDHIKPCAAFNLVDPEEQKKCFNYTNMQPLWSTDNWKKNSFHEGVLIRKRRKICQP